VAAVPFGLRLLGPGALLAWAFGTVTRTRRAYLAALEDRAERLQREREALAQVAVAEERERIARELHDIIAHSVSLMIVASDGAEAAIEQENIGEARKAVAAIGRTGRDALTDVRVLLGLLRSDAGIAEPQPGIDQLEDLIESVPLKVRLHVEGPQRQIPQGLALAVFRIAQEALTNTVKHAGPQATGDVRLSYSSSAVEVEVSDDGRGLSHPGGNGHGLIGMRERVAMFGGTFTAGPRAHLVSAIQKLRARISTMPAGSEPFVGSSRISSLGSASMAAAMPSRCFMPSEYERYLSPALARRPERSRTGSTAERGSCPRRARTLRLSRQLSCG
jgi:glucose-6-phosphate-specific signal transduction histidine kinase